jgi:hypothetical protein
MEIKAKDTKAYITSLKLKSYEDALKLQDQLAKNSNLELECHTLNNQTAELHKQIEKINSTHHVELLNQKATYEQEITGIKKDQEAKLEG